MEEPGAEKALVAAGRMLAGRGLAPGSSGNVSVKTVDGFTITPTGVPLGGLSEKELALVDDEGRVLSTVAPSKEVPLHLAFYAKDPSFGAVVHLHSPYAVALSCCSPWSSQSAVPPITPYFVMRVGRTPLVPYARPGSRELAEQLAKLEGRFRATLLSNHGQLVAGPSLEAALDTAIELEEAARLVVLLGEQARILSDEEIVDIVEHFGAIW